MSKRLFDHDPFTGITQWFVPTEDDGFAIISEGDVEPILDANARKRAMGRQYYASDPDLWKVGSVPNIVLLKWATELGVPAHMVYSDEFAEIVAKRLNDSDFRNFKTADVSV